ncbi:unnamed protein product [Rotaria socialis]|uniref:Uncharacterized protein n=1 Tax=Rotaria socialis TaxID=392032 RepID=A0A817ZY32_9BILA|nr:unnamed protein product [Rotaria socialis]CAF3469489.1 unnamed protein product [Rotaria socialis]CAF3565689.1 unnamed protein product [Rotaria socialis]CAF3703745.1 unnamed protein product [Rotaria socialis]CAF4256770.1 unnamed protein product [Rotaria socialis]
MSVVPLGSPFLSSSGNNVDINYEKDSSSVSSLIVDYTLLNSIIESNQFEKTLELYSLMLNSCLNNIEEKISFEIFINEFIEEYSQIQSNEFKELIAIFQNKYFCSFISSYDLILQHYYQEKKLSSNTKFNVSDKNNDDDHHDKISRKKDHCSEKDEQNSTVSMLYSTKLIDEEKENSNYASKLAEYNVGRLKIVRLEKRQGEPLGATISRLSDHDYQIIIARIVHGSIAQGLFSIGDQLLEINNINIQSEYRTLDEIVQLIDSLHGTISFLLMPCDEINHGIHNQAFNHNQDDSSVIYVRALFSYDPYDDMYIPCRELGLSFEKYSILNIVNRDDPSWWQAVIMENDQNNKKQQLPGLIPSKQFQEKRFKIVKCLLDEETSHSKKKFKDKFNKSIAKQTTRQKILTTFSFNIYEPVEWYIPNELQKRPIVLIGAPHIGRHELRQRLMNSSQLSSLIDVAVPHTTRLKKQDEIDGRDYYFITREQFEKDISNDLFVEHGEYEKNLYGTSKLAIEACCHIYNKICILNLLPEGLDSLKYSNILPFIIYLKCPSTIEKLREYFYVNDQQWIEIEEKSRFIEQNYSHLFDKIIYLNDSFDYVFSQLKFLVKDVQTKPMWVNQCWFSPRERF